MIAALLLATFPPQLHFTRIGLVNAADPMIGVAMLAFLARGWRTGARRDFVLAGLMLGMTQYFFAGGKLLFSGLLIVWFLWAQVQSRLPLRHLVSVFVTAILVSLSVVYAFNAFDWEMESCIRLSGHSLEHGLNLLLGHASGDEIHAFYEHVVKSFMIYVNWSDGQALYGGMQPLILVFLVPFFY